MVYFFGASNMKYKDFIENKYADNYEINDFNLNHITEAMVQDSIVDETVLNEDRTSTVVNLLSIGLIMKMKNQVKKINNETDTNKKIDALGALVQLGGYGGLIGGFIGGKNTRILNKIRGLKR
jgi:hypothetical protein